LLLLSAPATSGQGENAVEVGRTQWTGRWVTHTGVLKVFGKNTTSDVLYVVGRSFRILTKKTNCTTTLETARQIY
jgi:hypothetical protein